MPSPAADRQLVAAFVQATEGRSTREVARATGLSHQIIAEYRRGHRPMYLRQSSREAMDRYLRHSGHHPEAELSDVTRARVLELTEQLREAVWAGDVEAARQCVLELEEALA